MSHYLEVRQMALQIALDKGCTDIKVNPGDGSFEGRTESGVLFRASPNLYVIRHAWYKGCNFEDLADGFGEGEGTDGDWSGIRDSTDGAIEAMVGKAVMFLTMTGEVE